MEYVVFGAKRDVVWSLWESPTGIDFLVRALKTRGFSDVVPATPTEESDDPQSVWEEHRYLDSPRNEKGETNRPEHVFMLFRQAKPISPLEAIAASTSRDIADKVAGALNLTFPQWSIEVRPIGQPE